MTFPDALERTLTIPIVWQTMEKYRYESVEVSCAMRLTLEHEDGKQVDYRFTRGPIYIGRHSHCQIILPNRTVSRQHAVLYVTQDGQTLLQDLNSANGTLLNGQRIHKDRVKTGDRIAIVDFIITVNLEDDPRVDRPLRLDDTLIGVAHEPQIIVRELHVEHAPDITLPAERARDFARASKQICRANGPQATLDTLLEILFEQFHPDRAWCALREGLEGPMEREAGRTAAGLGVELHDLELRQHIVRAVHAGQFLLLPQNAQSTPVKGLNSAIIAPLLETNGSVGVLYVDKRGPGEHYSLRDLDYLVLLAIHVAAVFENF